MPVSVGTLILPVFLCVVNLLGHEADKGIHVGGLATCLQISRMASPAVAAAKQVAMAVFPDVVQIGAQLRWTGRALGACNIKQQPEIGRAHV